jgi:hypothetical protein
VVLTVVVTGAVDVVDVGVFIAELVVMVDVLVIAVDVLVVVEEEQDANASDVTMRNVSAIQKIPLFILPPSFNI